MKKHLRIAIAQLNFTVGALTENSTKIIDYIKKARDELKADLVIFPELALTGYPLEDLLHRVNLYKQANVALKKIQEQVTGIDVLLGYPERTAQGDFNSAIWLRNKKSITIYHKQKLPNYSVFDELRYFMPGQEPAVVEFHDIRFGILICEDVWYPGPVTQLKNAYTQCIICLNASPYSIYKTQKREEVLKKRINEAGIPIIYANAVGGQDELVFDGGSLVIDRNQKICAQAQYFQEQLLLVELDVNGTPVSQTLPKPLSKPESVYEALKLGVKDYINKNRFPGALIGLSGGIDSALTLAIAVDALGADKVTAVFMPSQYTSTMSQEDALQQINTLKINHHIIPIDNIFRSFLIELKNIFGNKKPDSTEENIQARIRGVLLMALSNKTGNLVLTTGNKSEMAVGYATLYGDMAGGFAVLKDIFKTLVYELARYRNTLSPIIPERVMTRAPSAELAPNQKDQDTLPPYEKLDEILKLFIEEDCDIEDMAKQGIDHPLAEQIIHKILNNEYKRRQAPLGVRISEKGFGKDRRYPITSRYLKE